MSLLFHANPVARFHAYSSKYEPPKWTTPHGLLSHFDRRERLLIGLPYILAERYPVLTSQPLKVAALEPSLGETTPAKPPWWHATDLPWTGKPSRPEIFCWSLIGFITIYGIVLAPFRAAVPTWNIYAWNALTGSPVSMVTLGAFTAVRSEPFWWLGIILATLALVKFMPVYWWAGRLWGTNLIERIAGRSKLSRIRSETAKKVVDRFGPLALVLMYVLPVFPTFIVCALAGVAGMKLRQLILWNLAGALLTRIAYFIAGYLIGQPVIDAFHFLEKYLNYASYLLVALVIIYLIRLAQKAKKSRGTDN